MLQLDGHIEYGFCTTDDVAVVYGVGTSYVAHYKAFNDGEVYCRRTNFKGDLSNQRAMEFAEKLFAAS